MAKKGEAVEWTEEEETGREGGTVDHPDNTTIRESGKEVVVDTGGE